MKERLQKLLSNNGMCSRRKAEQLIREERVKVNGRVALIGEKADINYDQIKVDKFIVNKNINHKVILLNKPIGVICSCNDERGRKTVIDILPTKIQNGLYPIGRLDKFSRGALLLTNHGLLTLKLTHPRYNHKKVYFVWITGIPSEETLTLWRKGIYINKKHHNSKLKRLEGWWGVKEEQRFKMNKNFVGSGNVDAWQLSNPSILSMAAHKASLDIFMEAGMDKLVKKSKRLTSYLEFLINDLVKNRSGYEIITPKESEYRGCQISFMISEGAKDFHDFLFENNIVVDFREPNVIRISPVPLYNSFLDVFYTFWSWSIFACKS